MKERIIVRTDTQVSRFSKTGSEMEKSTCDWKLNFIWSKKVKHSTYLLRTTPGAFTTSLSTEDPRTNSGSSRTGERIPDWIKPSRRFLSTEPMLCEKLLKEAHYGND